MYSQVINYIKQRIEISRQEIEESPKHSDIRRLYTENRRILPIYRFSE
jgi:hypothetical protein